MVCKEFEKQIPAFIRRKLKHETLKLFCEHVETCKECKEELLIQFLVTEGLNRLEEGKTFDLQGELDRRLLEALRKIKRRKAFFVIGIVLGVLIAVAGAVIWYVF